MGEWKHGLGTRVIGKVASYADEEVHRLSYDRVALGEGASEKVLFAPPNAVALALSSDEKVLFSLRLELGGADEFAWTLERYRWPERQRLDSSPVFGVAAEELLDAGDLEALFEIVRERSDADESSETLEHEVAHLRATHANAAALLELLSALGDAELRFADLAREALPAGLRDLAAGRASAAASACSERSLVKLSDSGIALTARARSAVGSRLTKSRSSAAAVAALAQISAAFPQKCTDFELRPRCERLLPHALAALDGAEKLLDASTEQALLSARVARFLKEKAKLALAEKLARRSVTIVERLAGKEHPDLFVPLLALGDVLMTRERPAQGVVFLSRALGIAEAAYGENSAETAEALTLLGAALYLDDQLPDAIEALRRSLAVRRAVFPAKHAMVAVGLNDLGAVIMDQEPEAAESMLREALELRERALGETHPDVGVTLDNLASLLDDTDRPTEAMQLSRRAVDVFERCYGPNHQDVAIALGNMANRLNDELELPEDAEPYYLRALAAKEEIFGVQSPAAADAQRVLGMCLSDQGEHRHAVTCYRCALAIDETEHGDSHLDVAEDLNLLATALEETGEAGNRPEAEAAYRRALGIVERECEAPHRRIGSACHNLANFLRNDGRYEEAKQLFLRAIENHEGAGEESRGKLAHSLNILSQLLLATEDYREAEERARRALEIDEELHGEDDPEVTGALHWLARAVAGQGRYDEAETHLLRALAINEETSGVDSNAVNTDLRALGAVLVQAERWDEAAKVYARKLTLAEQLYDEHSLVVARTLDSLALAHEKLDNLEGAEHALARAVEIYELEPEGNRIELELGHERLARLLVRQGRPLEAREHFDRAFELGKEDENLLN
jgi:tetratricopeptide (TPR) repeat protein